MRLPAAQRTIRRMTANGMLTGVEKGMFLSLVNGGEYVLNFTTSDFDAFTMQSVGIPLTDRFR